MACNQVFVSVQSQSFVAFAADQAEFSCDERKSLGIALEQGLNEFRAIALALEEWGQVEDCSSLVNIIAEQNAFIPSSSSLFVILACHLFEELLKLDLGKIAGRLEQESFSLLTVADLDVASTLYSSSNLAVLLQLHVLEHERQCFD